MCGEQLTYLFRTLLANSTASLSLKSAEASSSPGKAGRKELTSEESAWSTLGILANPAKAHDGGKTMKVQ